MQRIFNLVPLTSNRHCTCTHPLATSRPWLRCTPRVWSGLTAPWAPIRTTKRVGLVRPWNPDPNPCQADPSVESRSDTVDRLALPWNPDPTTRTGWPFRGNPDLSYLVGWPFRGNPDLTTTELLRPRSPTQPSPNRGLDAASVLLYCATKPW